MNLNQFELLYRDAIDDILNQLQSLNLLAAQLQTQLQSLDSPELQLQLSLASDIELQSLQLGASLQRFTLSVESFIQSQRNL
jgi:hypothetical protein